MNRNFLNLVLGIILISSTHSALGSYESGISFKLSEGTRLVLNEIEKQEDGTVILHFPRIFTEGRLFWINWDEVRHEESTTALCDLLDMDFFDYQVRILPENEARKMKFLSGDFSLRNVRMGRDYYELIACQPR